MRILIVEDHEKLAQALKKGLEQNGYAVDYILDGEAAERRIKMRHGDYDLLLLDLLLPGKSGFEICQSVRESGITLPILVLTARDLVNDKVTVLDSGADDYLVKPFSFEELVARIRALLRRPTEVLGKEVQIKDLVINPATREVRRGDKPVMLTLKEFELLHYLMRHPNEALTREDLYVHLWDFASNAMSNIIDVHMKNLRRKIDEESNEKLLETVWGVGYKIR